MLQIFLDAILDTLKLLPFLFAVYFLVELAKKRSGLQARMEKVLSSPAAPLYGAALGLIPQCGFGVVATSLYAKKHLNIGTLLAIYLSVSDEALPILFSTPSAYSKILPLLVTKLIIAISTGFVVNFIFAKIKKYGGVKNAAPSEGKNSVSGYDCEEKISASGCDCEGKNSASGYDCEGENSASGYDCEGKISASGCGCGGETTKDIFLHSLLHTAKVCLFVLLVNILLNILLFFCKDSLPAFMESTPYLQPLLAAVLGLVPNCASSVAITELYIAGTLSLGATTAGLCCNTGVAIIFLFKENKNIKQNLIILASLFVISISAGMLITAIL